jgi:hypothetical protein
VPVAVVTDAAHDEPFQAGREGGAVDPGTLQLDGAQVVDLGEAVA